MKKILPLCVVLLLGGMFTGCEENNSTTQTKKVEQTESPEKIIKIIDKEETGFTIHAVLEVDGHKFYTITNWEGGLKAFHLPSCWCFKDSVKQ